MSENTIRADIQRLTKEVVDAGSKAALVGGEWEQVLKRVKQCVLLERLASRPYTDLELMAFFQEVRVHHKFIMDTANKKRRAHPERSKRRFL